MCSDSLLEGEVSVTSFHIEERLYGGTGISGHLWRAERKI